MLLPSGSVCDLLLDGRLLPDCAIPKEHLGHNLEEHCLEDTRKSDALPTLVGGHHFTGRYVLW